jgi:hypothetical protein
MDKVRFARELVRIAERKCADRADWRKKFDDVRRERRIAQWILGICVFVAFSLLVFVVVIKWGELVNRLSQARAPIASFPLLMRLSIGCAGCAVSFAGLARLTLISCSRQMVSYPVSDRDSLVREVRGVGIVAGTFAALATISVQAVLLGGHIHSWLDGATVVLLAAAQVFCVASLIALLATRRIRWIPDWLLLLSGLIVMLASLNDGLARTVAGWRSLAEIWPVASVVPTSWPNLAFYYVIVERNLLGVIWLAPLLILVWWGFRSLRRDLQVLEYVSTGPRSEMPVFAETSPLAPRRTEVVRQADAPEQCTHDARPRITGALAAEALCREMRRGEMPRSWLVRMLLDRLSSSSRLLTVLGSPSLMQWRFPWVTMFVAMSTAGGLIWLVPYDKSVRVSEMLVFQLSLCLAMTLWVANLTKIARRGYWDPMSLCSFPVSHQRWIVARLRLLLLGAIGSVAPVAFLLAVLQNTLQAAPLEKTGWQGIGAIVMVATCSTLYVCGDFLLRTQISRNCVVRLATVAVGGIFGLSLVIPVCEAVFPHSFLPALVVGGCLIVLCPMLTIRMVRHWEVDLPS